jgi:hypothetical protein
MRLRLPLLLLPALFACAPAVTHGPRVERGLSLNVTGGLPRTLCRTDCIAGVIPTFGAGARYGWVADAPGRPSYQLGALVPIWDPVGFELDPFVQAPARGAWAYGAGSLVSARHLVPYVEVGNMPPRGDGWYLSLAHAWLFADPTELVGTDPSEGEFGMARPPRFWAPGVGFRMVRDEGRSVTFYANASLGSYVDREARYVGGDPPQSVPVEVRKPVRVLMIGATAEITSRAFRRMRFPPSRPRPPLPPQPPPVPN